MAPPTQAPLRVELAGASSRRVGPQRGLARRDASSWQRRLRSAADEVREAGAQGMLPHVAWWSESAPKATDLTTPCTISGEPGAVDAVCLGLPELDHARVHRHTGPFDVPVVQVDGAPSVGETTQEDLRFGPFSPTAVALRRAVLGREDSDEVDRRLAEARQAVASAATDMGADAALGLVASAWKGATPTVLCRPELLDLGTWWGRVLTAVTCKPTGDSGPQVLRGLAPRVALMGDEAALQAAVFGQPPSPVVLLVAARPSADQRARTQATSETLARRGCPVVVLTLPGTTAADKVPAAWVLLHAALTLAVVIGAPPLTLAAGEDLRRLLVSTGHAPA